eukprot:5159218-Karenia_brevis.AAC.1
MVDGREILAASEEDEQEALVMAGPLHLQSYEVQKNLESLLHLTPLRIFKRQYLFEQSVVGRTLNPACKLTWAEVKSKFASLPQDHSFHDEQSFA